MKYDIIVIGGGPGGLMAAKVAAEDGLKVLLVERKRSITEINRACSQIFYTRKLSPSGESETGKPRSDGYIEPVSVEFFSDKTRFHFEKPGFSVDYSGCIRPYLNWLHVSPGGYFVNRYQTNHRPWGFCFHKEILVQDLLTDAEKAGVEVRTNTIGLGAENTPQGVSVRLRGKTGEEVVLARAVIAADGIRSQIADSVGLTEKRQVIGPNRVGAFLQYIIEGVETGFPISSWLTWTIPSLNPGGFVAIGLSSGDCHKLGTLTSGDTSPADILNTFMKHPKWAHMFRNARIVKKEGMSRTGPLLGPIREPVVGNVVVIGDAGAIAETWVQGALACAHQAVKAVKKELAGERGGYAEYTAWWQRAFAFNTPDYLKMVSGLYPLPRIATDDDMDYIYKMFGDRVGIPQVMLTHNLERVKAERPSLYEKLEQVTKRMREAQK
jgi:digeranylgeranylglycerophospholipid reductase